MFGGGLLPPPFRGRRRDAASERLGECGEELSLALLVFFIFFW